MICLPLVAEQRRKEASTENTSLKVTSRFPLLCFVLHVTPSLGAPLHSCNLPLLSLSSHIFLASSVFSLLFDFSHHVQPAGFESCISHWYIKPWQMSLVFSVVIHVSFQETALSNILIHSFPFFFWLCTILEWRTFSVSLAQSIPIPKQLCIRSAAHCTSSSDSALSHVINIHRSLCNFTPKQ